MVLPKVITFSIKFLVFSPCYTSLGDYSSLVRAVLYMQDGRALVEKTLGIPIVLDSGGGTEDWRYISYTD